MCPYSQRMQGAACFFFSPAATFFLPAHAHCSQGISERIYARAGHAISLLQHKSIGNAQMSSRSSVHVWATEKLMLVLIRLWSTNPNRFSPTNSQENGYCMYGRTRLGQLKLYFQDLKTFLMGNKYPQKLWNNPAQLFGKTS